MSSGEESQAPDRARGEGGFKEAADTGVFAKYGMSHPSFSKLSECQF